MNKIDLAWLDLGEKVLHRYKLILDILYKQKIIFKLPQNLNGKIKNFSVVKLSFECGVVETNRKLRTGVHDVFTIHFTVVFTTNFYIVYLKASHYHNDLNHSHSKNIM